LTFRSAYTWSHTIDNSDSAFSNSTTDAGARVFLDPNGNPLLGDNRGNADQDIRQIFAFASMYELPFGRGRQLGSNWSPALNHILGGWQWNNIVTLQSGTPIDLYVTGAPEDRPDLTGPASTDIVDGKGIIRGDFTAPPVNAAGVYIRPGSLGRNALYGPGLHTWDTGMMKDFTIESRFKLEFRGDFFNMLNRPQFDNFSFNTNALETDTNPGIATTRFSSARELQLAVRITF
jgi:hypothetical protein